MTTLPKIKFLESFVKMPIMNLHVQSVYIETEKGKILISPGSQLTAEQLESLDHVTDIVAPNLYHCAGIKKASKVFPDAKLWGPLAADKVKPNIQWEDILTEQSWPYQNELQMLMIEGMPKVNEVVFLHKETKSLIVTDLCFNMVDVKGFGAWIILKLFGTYKKLAISKFFLNGSKDKTATKQSLDRLLSFDFENIIVSHGENVIGGGKEKLKEALSERGY